MVGYHGLGLETPSQGSSLIPLSTALRNTDTGSYSKCYNQADLDNLGSTFKQKFGSCATLFLTNCLNRSQRAAEAIPEMFSTTAEERRVSQPGLPGFCLVSFQSQEALGEARERNRPGSCLAGVVRRSSGLRIPLSTSGRDLPAPHEARRARPRGLWKQTFSFGKASPPEGPSSLSAALPGAVGPHLPPLPFPNSPREESGAPFASPGWAGQRGFSAAQDAEPGRMERCPAPGAPSAWPGLLVLQRALPAQHHPRSRRLQQDAPRGAG